jgi:hypothetical protein
VEHAVAQRTVTLHHGALLATKVARATRAERPGAVGQAFPAVSLEFSAQVRAARVNAVGRFRERVDDNQPTPCARSASKTLIVFHDTRAAVLKSARYRRSVRQKMRFRQIRARAAMRKPQPAKELLDACRALVVDAAQEAPRINCAPPPRNCLAQFILRVSCFEHRITQRDVIREGLWWLRSRPGSEPHSTWWRLLNKRSANPARAAKMPGARGSSKRPAAADNATTSDTAR